MRKVSVRPSFLLEVLEISGPQTMLVLEVVSDPLFWVPLISTGEYDRLSKYITSSYGEDCMPF